MSQYPNNLHPFIKIALVDQGYSPEMEGVQEYLQDLSEDYDIPLEDVHTMYYANGLSELFDGLVCDCQDYADKQMMN